LSELCYCFETDSVGGEGVKREKKKEEEEERECYLFGSGSIDFISS